jgi:acetolactate synthase regulatory subunit
MAQTKALQVEQALRIVAEQAHATAQLAVTALKAIALREIELTRIDAKSASVLIVRSEKPVNEELLKQLGGLLDIEVINVGFGHGLKYSFEVRP